MFPVEREKRKPSVNKLGSFGEKKNQRILVWNAHLPEYDAETALKKWTRFLSKFMANFAFFSSYPIDPTEKNTNIF